tara:strand:+ start:789 stop:1715 length:927 start_codon:yes stop_codon:yes gene_type:complete
MNYKNIGIGLVILLLIIGGIWTFMIRSYEEDLGTNNIFFANDAPNNLTNEKNNSLFELSFSKADESLEWTKVSISIENETQKMDCSKGNFTSNDIGNAKVSPKLSSDGMTFTVIVDATSEDDFTHVDLDNLLETDNSNYDIRFSKTDIFLSSNVTGSIVEDTEFEELVDIPDQEFTETSGERLDWYDYKLTTHRIEVEDKIYVIKIEDRAYKIKFISYYNEDDEPRYVSFMIGALGGTTFPALSNPDLVSPAKCTIIELNDKSELWEKNETIAIYENDFNICSTSCSIKITITYEGIVMKGNQTLEIE